MALEVGDVAPLAITLKLSTTLGSSVARMLVRYNAGGGVVEWNLTPDSTTADAVFFVRELAAGDLPDVAPSGYKMKAWVYDSLDACLLVTEPFQGPPVYPATVTPPT